MSYVGFEGWAGKVMGIGRLPKGVTLQICMGQGPAVPLVVVVGWGCPPFLLG